MAKSNEFDITLIDLVRDRPALWDCRTADYKSNEKKTDIWNEIAENIGASVGVVKTRYHNLRTAFRKSLVLIAKWHSAAPSARKGHPPRPYIYHAELEFLEEIFQIENPTYSTNNVSVKVESDDESTFDVASAASETTNEPTTSVGTRKRNTAADSYSDQLDMKSARLVDATTVYNDTGSGVIKYEDNDDWLFVQRLFLKLRKIPDDLNKERLKLKLDMEVLNAMELRASRTTHGVLDGSLRSLSRPSSP